MNIEKRIIAMMTKNADRRILSRDVSLKVFFAMVKILLSMVVVVSELMILGAFR